ncbi:MAG: glucoamylase family protein, partial [Bacteroidota bacterium]
MFDKPRYLLVFFLLLMSACGDDDTVSQADQLFLEEVSIDNVPVLENETLFNVDISPKINLRFSEPVELEALQDNLQLTNNSNSIDYELFQTADNEFNLELPTALRANTFYILDISDGLISASGNGFDKINYQFRTEELSIELVNISSGTSDILGIDRALDVSRSLDFNLEFNAEVDVNSLASGITIGSGYELILDQKDEHTVNVATSTDLPELSRFVLSISDNVKGANGEAFTGYAREFYTTVDSVFDFPEIPDEELLTKIQQQTFKYFYDFGHPVSGLTRERNTSGETVTIGGSGFGVMSIIVGIERGFITREEGVERWEIITDFLETKADRFHGVWSHWLNGTTGDVIPFRADDNGGDLVETAFMIQGLLTVRQYLNPVLAAEKTIIDRINRLVDEVEWDWYTQGGQNVLYWHWSPNFGWQKNLAIQGWNESLIVYVLAAASANHSIEKEVYDNGWARQGAMVNSNDNTHYGYTMDLRSDRGGPLFFSHYSFLGLDPRNL